MSSRGEKIGVKILHDPPGRRVEISDAAKYFRGGSRQDLPGIGDLYQTLDGFPVAKTMQ